MAPRALPSCFTTFIFTVCNFLRGEFKFCFYQAKLKFVKYKRSYSKTKNFKIRKGSFECE